MYKFNLSLLSDATIKIGVLGGSFNPPHEGHIHISLQTLKRFGLKQIFWLVTPCSPTKHISIYASLEERYMRSIELTKKYSNKITVLDSEKFLRNFYSINTINTINQHNVMATIYWIIGCDNILQLHKWHHWKQIVPQVKLVVCERNAISMKIPNTKAANNFSCQYLLPCNQFITKNIDFYMLHMPKKNISSTQLRHES